MTTYHDGLCDGIRIAAILIQQDGFPIEDVARLVDGVDFGEDEVCEAHLATIREIMQMEYPGNEQPASTPSEAGFDDLAMQSDAECGARKQ